MPLHKEARCDMEIAQNFVAMPHPDETYGVCINVLEEKRHGATCSEGLDGDVAWMKSQILSHVGTCGS